ncbi:MAG: regulatory protein RecX [Treponema sp.]|nr:regulatory protein RecX [Treponema sp.]
MVIYGTEQVSPEVIKINSSAGLAFFIRLSYLNVVSPEKIVLDAEFEGQEEQDIIDAGMCYAAEMKAVEYLARAEQCRFRLSQKLLQKNYEKQYVSRALDYLEHKNYLNDARFAEFWLNGRKINHSEGRTKLLAELLARGIAKDVAQTALENFFQNNSEIDLCRRDYEKCLRIKKDPDKIVRTLISHGFQYSLIKKIMSEEPED